MGLGNIIVGFMAVLALASCENKSAYEARHGEDKTSQGLNYYIPANSSQNTTSTNSANNANSSDLKAQIQFKGTDGSEAMKGRVRIQIGMDDSKFRYYLNDVIEISCPLIRSTSSPTKVINKEKYRVFYCMPVSSNSDDTIRYEVLVLRNMVGATTIVQLKVFQTGVTNPKVLLGTIDLNSQSGGSNGS